MRIVKPQQLSLLSRPFEYRGGCYLGISVMAAVRLAGDGRLIPEVEMWQEAMSALDDQAVLDVGMPKRGGEFLASGHAFAPNGEPVRSMRAGIQVGDLAKELWVFGDRSIEGDRISEPSPFESIPFTWEHAFGGEGFKPNPLGKGYRATVNALGEKRHWLPNIEYPDQLYRLKGQRPDPANFGPVDITWPQRMSMAGTYDDRWLKTAFPGFARDIRWEYFNLASRDQWSERPFGGHESYRVYGLHPDRSVIEGNLPAIRTRCFYLRKGASALEECKCELTTLWFLPGGNLLVLVHHGSIEVREDDAHDLDSVMIAAEHQSQPRDHSHYDAVYRKRADPDGDPMELIRDGPLMPDGMAHSIIQPILDDYAKDGETPLARNMESAIAESVDGLRSKTEELGHEFPEDQLPERTYEPLPDFNEFDAYMEEKLQQLETAQQDMEKKKEAVRAQVLGQLENQPDYVPSLEEVEDSAQASGPPKFSAVAQREKLREQIQQVRAIGSDPSELEGLFDTDEQFAAWQAAERQFNDLYRMGAHFQVPFGPGADSHALRRQLDELLAAGADLSGRDFSGIDLSGADLRKRDLSGVFMESAVLDGADLSGAKLDQAVFAHATLSDTILDGASLKEANLGMARMKRVSAKNAAFDETILQRASLEECDFSGSRMSGMQLFLEAEAARCVFAGAEIENLFVNERSMAETDFSGSTLIDPIFIKANLAGADFSGATMKEAVFVGCNAVRASFAGAKLAGSVFVDGCHLPDCDFSGADLARVNFRGSVLHRTCFDDARLDEADLSDIEAGGATFRGVAAAQSRWVRADLREADLSAAVVIGAVLQKADIRGTDLRANLYQADLGRVHVERSTNFDGAFTAKMNTYPRKFPKESEPNG